MLSSVKSSVTQFFYPSLERQVQNLDNTIASIEKDIDPDHPTFMNKVRKGIEYVGVGFGSAGGAGAGALGAMIFAAGGWIIAGAAATGAAVMAVVAYSQADFDLAKRRKEGIKQINTLNIELVKKKLQLLREAKSGAIVDFTLGRESKIKIENDGQNEPPPQNQHNQKGRTQGKKANKKISDQRIEPVLFDAGIYAELLSILKLQARKSNKIKLRTIDISGMSLKPEQLDNLLTAGLGNFDTANLCLKNDEHSEQTIRVLKEHIVDKKDAFQQLKSLDLSGNELTGDCLENLSEIVQYLNLEKLTLSNNPQLGGNSDQNGKVIPASTAPLCAFLKQEEVKMPSLKHLDLENVGLQNNQGDALAAFIRKSLLLEMVDISKNEDLSLANLRGIVENGLKKNISVEIFFSDQSTFLDINDLLREHSVAIKNAGFNPISDETRAHFIVSKKLKAEKLADVLVKILEESALSEDKLGKIVDTINEAREEHLGVKEGLKIPISEQELISYRAKNLAEFYHEVTTGTGKAKEQVAKALVDNIKEVPAPAGRSRRQSRSAVPAEEVPAPAARSRRQSRSAVPAAEAPAPAERSGRQTRSSARADVAQEAAKEAGAAILTQAKNASLRAEIEAQLAREGARPVTNTGRFRV